LSDKDAVEALIGHAESAAGPLDILVNNAGITRDGLIVRMKDEDFTDVIGVNLEVAFRLARSVVRGMMKRRSGRIISITSVVGVTGNAGQVNYAASKAGLIGFTKSLAQEVASRGITANCVAPGFISTAMTEALSDAQRDTMMAAIPAGRFGESKDVAAAVAYLASNEAAYVTGQTLHVNGGMAMV
jgi:3-oxoacyl-[acyl-carrier protein] reductase